MARQIHPTAYGWTYVGENAQSYVEFYQRSGPKKGSIKTPIAHPTQGKTQLFRRDLSEEQHNSVCKNPRTHKPHGYQRKHW